MAVGGTVTVGVAANTTVELGEFTSKQVSPRLLLPVTVMSGLVLEFAPPGPMLLAERVCPVSNMNVPHLLCRTV